MQLRRLRLENFRQHADTDLTLGPGLTAIIGPNGVGKTTLLEAIAWTFYGTPAARGNRDFIRWNRAPARARVVAEVEFGLGAHEYRVVRTLHTAELYQDGGSSPVASSAREVTARLERLFGMSRTEFFHTYFTGQKELAAFQAMGPTDRARFLSRVLGYERLKLAQDRLRDTRTHLKGELAGVEAALGDPEVIERELAETSARLAAAAVAAVHAVAVRAAAVERREAVGPVWTAVVALRERVIALESDRRAADQHVDEARRAFERLDKDLAEALASQNRLKELAPRLADVQPLRDELERLEHEARGAKRRIEITGQRKEVAEKLADLHAKLAEAGEAGSRLADARAVLDAARALLSERQETAKAAHAAWVRNKTDAETQRRTLRDQYREFVAQRKQIQDAGKDGACPTCHRPLGEEYTSVIATLERQMEEIELNGKFFASRAKQLEASPEAVRAGDAAVQVEERAVEAAQEAASAASASVRDVDEWSRARGREAERLAVLDAEVARLPDRYDSERHDSVRALLREREPLLADAARLAASAERAERLVIEAEEAEQSMSQREAYARDLAGAIAELGFRPADYDAARGAYEAAERALRDADVELATRAGDRKAAEQARVAAERRQAERAARAERSRELKADLHLHDELDRALGDLRTDLNAQLRPELADLASRLLAELTDGRYAEIELNEQYDVLVLEEGEAKPVISGGEEDVAHLVLRLAISQMVAARAGQPLSLLVLDEIFGSLDESRRQHVLAVLRGLGDRFPQVVLITHIESVRDAVDRVLRVQLDPARGAAMVTEDTGVSDVAA